jgi:hypothetical protein
MANMFETVILNMRDAGMYQFLLPFLLSMAFFYGLLRKSKLFGDPKETVSLNAVVAIVASFMVWSAPIVLGIDIEQNMAGFFVQAMTGMVVLVVGLLITSLFFPPDLTKELSAALNMSRWGAAFLIFGILIAVTILISSGLVNVFLPEGWRFSLSDISVDAVSQIFVIVLIIGAIVFIVWGGD